MEHYYGISYCNKTRKNQEITEEEESFIHFDKGSILFHFHKAHIEMPAFLLRRWASGRYWWRVVPRDPARLASEA